MAMRRPRVKVAANLAIRRPTKAAAAATPKDDKTSDVTEYNTKETTDENVSDDQVAVSLPISEAEQPGASISSDSPLVDNSGFKFPKPVDEPPKITTPAPTSNNYVENGTEEPHSPKKLDTKFAYINALNSPRKRIRTESMTSNKSYSDVSLKSRKVIKQEETQKATDAKRDLRKRLNNIQNIDKQSLTMFDMIYYNPAKNPMKNGASLSKKGSLENIPSSVDRSSRGSSKSRSPTPVSTKMLPPPPVEQPNPTPQLTPQLKLGPNGEMILDEASLVIENEREKEIRDTLAKTEIVYDDEFSGNSGYYSRFKRTKDWPPEETIRFYRCLHTIGTDFSMMIQLFPNRTRRDLKLKFKKEERLNIKLINKALLYPKEFNIEELKQQFEEEDEEIERQREVERHMKKEAEERLKSQKLAKKLQLNQSKNRNPKGRVSKSARVMLDGEQIAKTEVLLKPPKAKRKKYRTRTGKNSISQKEKHPTPVSTNHKRKPQFVDDVRDVPEDDCVMDISVNSEVDESDHENLKNSSEPDLPDVPDVPYVPNGQFSEYNIREPLSSLQSSTEDNSNEFSKEITSDHQPSSHISDDTPLDIDSMVIDIVDEESKRLYEIKPEPKVYPVRVFENTNITDTPNIITLQNLDDHSQTTVTYQEPSLCSESKNDIVNDMSSISADTSKYYEGCDMLYVPGSASTTSIQTVKNETYNPPANHMFNETLSEQQPYELKHPVNTTSTVIQSTQINLNKREAVYLNEQARSVESIISAVPDTSEIPSTSAESVTSVEPVTSFESVTLTASATSATSIAAIGSGTSYEVLQHTQDSSPAVSASLPGTSVQTEEQLSAGGSSRILDQSTEQEEAAQGLGPLEDIDINSLVLVESQDTTNPRKTIYEIYVIDPQTGKLSEKPLDVPPDIIKNIRTILEVGEE